MGGVGPTGRRLHRPTLPLELIGRSPRRAIQCLGMSEASEKARSHRLQRLHFMIGSRLAHPAAAVEALLSELKSGEPRPELWEALHAASVRDGVESQLATAYGKVTSAHRLQRLTPEAQAQLLMHAADFLQGVIGDAAAAEAQLERVFEIVPGHAEAFSRLRRRFEGACDNRRLVELYAAVAAAPPRPADELVGTVVNLIATVSAKTPISEPACKRLLALVPAGISILYELEAHCRKTGRADLACELIEQTILDHPLPKKSVADLRRELLAIYVEETSASEKALPHAEALLADDVRDTHARATAEKLLSNRLVASRAAALLQDVRRRSRAKRGGHGGAT